MAGIENITEYIIQKADADAKNTLKRADEQHDAAILKAKKDAESISSEIIKSAENEAETIRERAASGAAQIRSRNILTLKNRAVSEVIENAKKILLSLPDDEYMSLMEKLLRDSASGSEGIIVLNSADKARMSSGFSEAAADCGLTVSGECADISGGFILKYGLVEINCSVDAVFRDRNEQFVDYVNKRLFG